LSNISGGPAIAVSDDGILEMYFRDRQGRIFETYGVPSASAEHSALAFRFPHEIAEVGGNGVTSNDPRAAVVSGSTIVVIRGLDGLVYVNRKELGKWRGWAPVEGEFHANSAVGVASNGELVYLASIDGSGGIRYRTLSSEDY